MERWQDIKGILIPDRHKDDEGWKIYVYSASWCKPPRKRLGIRKYQIKPDGQMIEARRTIGAGKNKKRMDYFVYVELDHAEELMKALYQTIGDKSGGGQMQDRTFRGLMR